MMRVFRLLHAEDELDLSVQHMVQLRRTIDSYVKKNVSAAQERQKNSTIKGI